MRLVGLGFLIGLILGAAACAAAPTMAPPTAVLAVTQPPPTALPATNTPPPASATAPASTAATAAWTATVALPPTRAATATLAASPTAAGTGTPATVFITYEDFQILPAQTTLHVGDRVVFQIKAGLLTFHQPYNFTAPDTFEAPANLGDGATYAHTFTEAGTVTLLCGYHANMRAQLIVQP